MPKQEMQRGGRRPQLEPSRFLPPLFTPFPVPREGGTADAVLLWNAGGSLAGKIRRKLRPPGPSLLQGHAWTQVRPGERICFQPSPQMPDAIPLKKLPLSFRRLLQISLFRPYGAPTARFRTGRWPCSFRPAFSEPACAGLIEQGGATWQPGDL